MNLNLVLEILYSSCLIIFSLIFFFLVTKLCKRAITNKKFDKKLRIETSGLRKSSDNPNHHRTESTPYEALLSLYENYPIQKDRRIVDFGSGKGRVTIMLSHLYGNRTVGVELNDYTYMDAISNLRRYERFNPQCKDLIEFESTFAEEYEIQKEDSVFFFFNPFDVSIFEEVVLNIQNDAVKNSKKSEIILYYPTKKYVKFLENETKFKLKKEIKTQGAIFPLEKILIYEVQWETAINSFLLKFI